MSNFLKLMFLLLFTLGASSSSFADNNERRGGNRGPGNGGGRGPGNGNVGPGRGPGPGNGGGGGRVGPGRGAGSGNVGPGRGDRGPGRVGPGNGGGRGPGPGNVGPGNGGGRGPGPGNVGPGNGGGRGPGPGNVGPGNGGGRGPGPGNVGPGNGGGRGPGPGNVGPGNGGGRGPGPGNVGPGNGGGRGPGRVGPGRGPGPGHVGPGRGPWRPNNRWTNNHNRYGSREGWNFGRNYRYSRYNHAPYINIPRGHYNYYSSRDFFRTVPYRNIYWNRWLRWRVNYANGYFWYNNYPWFVYNGFQHRYSNQDVCDYELVDGRTNQAVNTFYGQYCNVGYDRCAMERDARNYQVGEYRYFCSEYVENDGSYDWDYNDDFYSDVGDNDGYYSDEYYN